MSYKPNDFLIGIGELLGFLLPGALAAYFLAPRVLQQLERMGHAPLTGAAAWVAFAVMAYLLGHLVFLLGSFLDRLYDPLREQLHPREHDTTYNEADRLQKEILGEHEQAVGTRYRFATAYLLLRNAEAAGEVKQLEADSKFFRSLAVLLPILIACSWGALSPLERGVGLVFAIVCFWRYAERRWKATQRAWEFLIVSSRLSPARGTDAS
jgi:hypothetical protein